MKHDACGREITRITVVQATKTVSRFTLNDAGLFAPSDPDCTVKVNTRYKHQDCGLHLNEKQTKKLYNRITIVV